MYEKNLSYTTHYFKKNINTTEYTGFVLGADVGGTTTNIAIAGLKNEKPKLLFTLDFKTKTLAGFLPALKLTLEYASKRHSIKIENGCIGAAGVVSPDHSFVDLTNIPWNIDTKTLLENTAMKSLFILNDFVVLGYGMNTIDESNEDQILCIRNPSDKNRKKTRVLLGAGTGLGKTVLRFDECDGFFHAFESEGGHVDIPVYNEDELALISSIRKRNHPDYPVCYEDLLSGSGLVEIFSYLKRNGQFEETSYTEEIEQSSEKAALIGKYRERDPCCKQTFQILTRFYARCAKNIALDTLAGGGVYLAGGVAQKNPEVITSVGFINEFNQSFMRSNFLKSIPLYLLKEYYLSLAGACFVAAHEEQINKKQ